MTMTQQPAFPRKHAKSKFVFDVKTMTLVHGIAPTRDGTVFKGETTTGEKMELAMGPGGCGPVAYDGWS